MEVIVSLFVIMVLTLGIYNLVILSLQLTNDNKMHVEAIEIANQKMERIRNMPYADVGIIAGAPSGIIPAVETIQREGTFTVNSYVSYFDDPYDGEAGSSTKPDTIINDYKIVSVKVSWQAKKTIKNLTMFSKIIPRTEETADGYGLLKIRVVNSNGLPVPAADVRIINNIIALPIDETNPTNGDGILPKPVKESFQGYEVIVSKAGYSTDQNHPITVENPNPSKKFLSVIEGDKTEETFSIDKLSTLNIHTVTDTLPDNWQVNTNTSSNDNSSPELSIDSSDNLYFSWVSSSATSSQVYAQKYNSLGVKQWAQDIKISDTQFQVKPDIKTTNSGVSYIVWQDNSVTLKSVTLNQQNRLAKINNTKRSQSTKLFHKFLKIHPQTNYQTSNTSPLIINQKNNFFTNNFFDFMNFKSANAAGPITFIGVGIGNATGKVNAITLQKPAGTLEDDFLLAYVFMRDYSSGPIDPPAGWNTLSDTFRPSGTGSDSRGALFWKIATAAEPNSYTFDVSQAYCTFFCYNYEQTAGHIRTYRGVDMADPFDGNLELQTTSEGDYLRPAPSHTVSTDGSFLVVGWGANTVSLGNNTPTFPADTSNQRNNFASYITAASADKPVNISDSPTSAKNFDANHSVVRSTIGWSIVLKPEATPDTITINSVDSQNASIIIPGGDEYIGGTFVFVDDTSSHDISKISIKESGTVDAENNLSNIRLNYDFDITAPYDCSSEIFNPGTDPMFGTASSSFSGADGTADFVEVGGITINTTQSLCVYVILDVDSEANNNETIEIEINNPSLDIYINSGDVLPGTTIEINGSTSLLKPAEINQNSYRFRNDDGDESLATWNNFENTVTTITSADDIRLRFLMTNTGGIDANPAQFRIEYAKKTAQCSTLPEVDWESLPFDNTKHWKITDSVNLTDGSSTTNVLGGLTDLGSNFVSGETKDQDNETAAITLVSDSFTEIEYSISPTSNANDSGYCFRLSDSGVSTDITYSIYPEISIVGDDNIYIVALNPDGTELWGVKRVNTDIASEYQGNPKIALTENYGQATTTIVWDDNRDGNTNIYAMSLDASGNKLWGADLQITSSSTSEHSPSIAVDQNDNIFIVWVEDNATSQDIYLQKLDLEGNTIWGSPKKIIGSNVDEYNPAIAISPTGNLQIVWEENISGIKNVNLASYTNDGINIWEIQPNLTNVDVDQSNPALWLDATHIYVSWTDKREGNLDIYTQKYDYTPNALWTNDLKINIITGASTQDFSKVIIDSSGDPIGVWEDNRDSDQNIYATNFYDPLALVNAPNIPLIITGTKKIGESPIIYKYTASSTTDAAGQLSLSLEWDVPGYSIEIDPSLSADTIKMRDPIQPLEILAEENKTMTIYID